MDITLNWYNPNAGTEDGTRIYRSNAPIPDSPLPTPLATVGTGVSTYKDTTAVAGQKYYYRTAAFKGSDQYLSKNRCVMALFPSQTGHGNQTLRAGDWDLGYFGTVTPAEFITPSSLASRFNIPGTLLNQDSMGWVKVAYKGKVLLFPNRGVLSGVKYSDIYNAGVAYGTNDNGIAVPSGSTATNQYKPFVVDNITYIPRLFKGLATDDAATIKLAMNASHNQLLANPGSIEWDDVVGAVVSYLPRWPDDTGYASLAALPEFGETTTTSTICQQTSGNTSIPLRGGRNGGNRFFATSYSATITATAGTSTGQDTPDSATAGATITAVWRPVLEVLN